MCDDDDDGNVEKVKGMKERVKGEGIDGGMGGEVKGGVCVDEKGVGGQVVLMD